MKSVGWMADEAFSVKKIKEESVLRGRLNS
jgi:hypothetical protein